MLLRVETWDSELYEWIMMSERYRENSNGRNDKKSLGKIDLDVDRWKEENAELIIGLGRD